MENKATGMQVVPAHPDYFALGYLESEDGLDIELTRTAIIAWCIDQENPDCIWPLPVMLDPQHEVCAVLRPDGVVEGNECDFDYPSVEVWLEKKRIEHFRGKASRAAYLSSLTAKESK